MIFRRYCFLFFGEILEERPQVNLREPRENNVVNLYRSMRQRRHICHIFLRWAGKTWKHLESEPKQHMQPHLHKARNVPQVEAVVEFYRGGQELGAHDAVEADRRLQKRCAESTNLGGKRAKVSTYHRPVNLRWERNRKMISSRRTEGVTLFCAKRFSTCF